MTATQAFHIEAVDDGTEHSTLHLKGALSLDEAGVLWKEAQQLVAARAGRKRIDFDLAGLERVDGGSMAVLLRLRTELQKNGISSQVVQAQQGQVEDILQLYEGEETESLRPSGVEVGLFEQVGGVTRELLGEIQLAFAFLGGMLRAAAAGLKSPGTINWRDLRPLLEQVGADGLAIVIVINFLIGFILAFQAAPQFHQYGADIFVADLVSLSITREMGPLMTAIIICGRSGAAFAAALGTMKVSEEIDALQTLGFDPLRFLVFPRMLALVVALPILTLLADFVAMTGGMMVGVLSLDLTVLGYFQETQSAVGLWDIGSGLLKSVVFAFAIAFIACQQGLATSGGAEGVGQRTTSSVVAILFSLIAIDAAFGVLFFVFDL